jgi:hypothetical protein
LPTRGISVLREHLANVDGGLGKEHAAQPLAAACSSLFGKLYAFVKSLQSMPRWRTTGRTVPTSRSFDPQSGSEAFLGPGSSPYTRPPAEAPGSVEPDMCGGRCTLVAPLRSPRAHARTSSSTVIGSYHMLGYWLTPVE